METTTSNLPRTAARSDQLVAASARTTLDPFVAVDWSVPIDDSAFHLPPEVLPLYGTAVWDSMSEAGRIAYSRHETSALCGAGIWFENVLMQAVLRHLAELPVTDPAHRYLLVEARHVNYAKTYLSEVWPQLEDEERQAITDAAPSLVAAVAEFSVDPAVYEHLGIEDGAMTARVNAHHRALVVAGLSKLTDFL